MTFESTSLNIAAGWRHLVSAEISKVCRRSIDFHTNLTSFPRAMPARQASTATEGIHGFIANQAAQGAAVLSGLSQ
jgi:hypothetical protein